MNDGCGTRVVIPADAGRVAELEAEVARLKAEVKAAAHVLGEALLIMARHSPGGMAQLKEWTDALEARAVEKGEAQASNNGGEA